MIIILRHDASEQDAQEILQKIDAAGLKPLHMPGSERTVIGALGDERVLESLHLENLPQVDLVKPVLSKYKLVSREIYAQDTVVQVGNTPVGSEQFTIMAGPCAIESEDQLLETARYVKQAGATVLRGGAFKPRTSPYSFQGLGVEGLKIMHQVGKETGLDTITELMDVNDLDDVARYISAIQIGARNMQNYTLLKAVGETQKPVLLKRGLSATIEELLLAAEYIVASGNPNVMICERGIRTFETATRNTLDLNAVAFIKERSHLPVIVDPSHGTGVRTLVSPMAKAAVACGADGVIIECHRSPKESVSDAAQALSPQDFHTLMQQLAPFVTASGRTLAEVAYAS
ncbi:3-deoxy-7-phosphoheptulonate synthase [Kangiella koreensis]|uniref:Phospho-2-dehydro-3-deoxyheptonate aldolase n=1 Tax=Kangiella koreensis (strain DSM 16069 / JCM 12317 / KCTC 12182 / SW-125) TaxID=523791 RepID=C7RCR8_KANKD|nr:3-deoxy-7-phosphoheptulonate synthase [Kangiella koreensis]ACV27060.1 phospho-2-dehydro-3-deoxyheptonate aldolase [Kangiella koreensis DSM 16069]